MTISAGVFEYNQDQHTLKLKDLNIRDPKIETAIDQLPLEILQKVQTLDLGGGCFLKALPANIKKFTQLRVLKLERCAELENIQCLTGLQIQELFAPYCYSLSDIKPLLNLPLKVLDLTSDKSIKNFDFVASFHQTLDRLILQNVPYAQSSAALLATMTRLQELNIKGSISDPTRFATIPNLVI